MTIHIYALEHHFESLEVVTLNIGPLLLFWRSSTSLKRYFLLELGMRLSQDLQAINGHGLEALKLFYAMEHEV
ncbi:hypothetical protein BVRB_2g044130 isoform A [Beta vulgaris subsp. vulgaris]|nr:hypothetical protein BVRB_2g044130 isoform A [Beta vulgaris subsp. vulgaris]